MAVDFELALLLAFAGLVGAIGVHFIWISHRPPTVRRTKQRTIDFTSGAKDDAHFISSLSANRLQCI
jgi:hypothetical protein